MTAQQGERILYQGKEHWMMSEPLSSYLSKQPHIQFHPLNTACWRGYVGHWEIRDNRLWLLALDTGIFGFLLNTKKLQADILDIESFRQERQRLRQQMREGHLTSNENQRQLKALKKRLTVTQEVSLQTLFQEPGPIFANWFDGVICLPQGKCLEYVHMGYASVYEEEIFLQFKEGVLLKHWRQKNERPQSTEEEEYEDEGFDDVDIEEPDYWLSKSQLDELKKAYRQASSDQRLLAQRIQAVYLMGCGRFPDEVARAWYRERKQVLNRLAPHRKDNLGPSLSYVEKKFRHYFTQYREGGLDALKPGYLKKLD